MIASSSSSTLSSHWHDCKDGDHPGPSSPLDSYEAAQSIFPSLARPLQKYLRITRYFSTSKVPLKIPGHCSSSKELHRYPNIHDHHRVSDSNRGTPWTASWPTWPPPSCTTWRPKPSSRSTSFQAPFFRSVLHRNDNNWLFQALVLRWIHMVLTMINPPRISLKTL